MNNRFHQLTHRSKHYYLRLMTCLLLLVASTAQAQSFCVFDVLGVQGPFYNAMREYATVAHTWGMDVNLKPYTDEQLATTAFSAGLCDAALVTGIRAREFNFFTSSIEAIGGLNNDVQMKAAIETLARPEAATLMTEDNVEVAGILPIGGVYIFLNDRAINSAEKIKGKRIAILDNDIVQLRLAKLLGFQPLASDINHFAATFNQGDSDIVVSPAIAYMPLELYKGVGNKGLVLKMPISQLSLQLLLHKDKFPAAFGQRSRSYFAQLFDTLIKPIHGAEDEILYFFPAPDGEYEHYQTLLRDARISMTAESIYDSRMMALLKKIRCKNMPSASECANSLESTKDRP